MLTSEDEREIVKDLNRNYFKPRAGDDWYLIPAKWYTGWKDYVQFDDTARSVAAEDSEDLRSGLREGIDYVIISPQVAQKFREWYGGDEPIPRRVIKSRRYFSSTTVVEVYPLLLHVQTSDPDSESKTLRTSKGATVGEFREAACKLFGIDPKDVRIWDYLGRKKQAYLARDTQELREASIMNNQPMLLELRNEDGTFPELPKSRVNAAAADFRPAAADLPAGCMGLTNMGNTCFMNSGLQCLLHTPPLVNHLLTGAYKADLNADNPLGSGLELTEAFTTLARVMWSARYEVIAPREFKHILGKHAEQFVGFNQHDAQEALAYLLDNIHEDLNRVKKKPLVDRVESDGQKSDDEVARDAWEAYLARNRSVIVDKFQGQFKSHLQCPVKECQRVSVTFDPFMYLSVPIPVETKTNVRVIVQRRDQRTPEALTVTVDKKGTMDDLRNKAAEAAGMDPSTLGPLCDVYNGTVFSIFDDSAPVTRICRGDITWAYEMEPEWGRSEGAEAGEGAAAGDAEDASATRAEEKAAALKRRQEKHKFVYALRQDLKQYVKTSTSVDEALKEDAARTRLAERLQGLREGMKEVAAQHGAAYDGEAAAQAEGQVPCCSTATLTCGHQHGPDAVERLDKTIDSLMELEVESEDEEEEEEPHMSGSRSWVGFNMSRKPITYSRNGWEVLVLLHQRNVPTTRQVTLAGVPCVVSFKRGRTTARDVMRQVYARIGHRCVDFDPEAEDLPCDLFAVPRHNHLVRGRDLVPPAGEGEEAGEGKRRDWDAPLEVARTEAVALRWHDADGKWIFNASASGSIKDRDCTERTQERGVLSLTECMEHFCSEEILSPLDTWFCPQCKDHVQAHKKVDLWTLPDVLIVHLKRFQAMSAFDVFSGGDKIDALVDFPISGLDMRPYLARSQSLERCRADGEAASEESWKYDLYAVSNHMGGTGGGHYTAHVLNEDGEWYLYDDTFVRPVQDTKRVVTESAYMLFYKRRDCSFESMREAFRAHPENEGHVDEHVEAAAAAHNYSYSNFGGYSSALPSSYPSYSTPYVPIGATTSLNPMFDDDFSVDGAADDDLERPDHRGSPSSARASPSDAQGGNNTNPNSDDEVDEELVDARRPPPVEDGL